MFVSVSLTEVVKRKRPSKRNNVCQDWLKVITVVKIEQNHGIISLSTSLARESKEVNQTFRNANFFSMFTA